MGIVQDLKTNTTLWRNASLGEAEDTFSTVSMVSIMYLEGVWQHMISVTMPARFLISGHMRVIILFTKIVSVLILIELNITPNPYIQKLVGFGLVINMMQLEILLMDAFQLKIFKLRITLVVAIND